jgi:hypothetical protein
MENRFINDKLEMLCKEAFVISSMYHLEIGSKGQMVSKKQLYQILRVLTKAQTKHLH